MLNIKPKNTCNMCVEEFKNVDEIFKLDEDKNIIILNSVNCSGILEDNFNIKLKEIRPELYRKYEYLTGVTIPEELITKVLMSGYREGNISLANIFTKKSIGNDITNIKLRSLKTSLKKVKVHIEKLQTIKGTTIYVPYKFCSSNSDKKWTKVYKLIDNLFKNYEIIIFKVKA